MSTFRKDNITASKLTPEKVVEMRHRYHNLRWTQGALAREYGVSVGQIGRIVRNEVWQAYTQIESPDELEHRAGTVQSLDIQASQERLKRLLAEPPKTDAFAPGERCNHGIRKGQFCLDCSEGNLGLARFDCEVEKLSQTIDGDSLLDELK